jgi:Tfp pilus assembly protein PilX
MKQMTKHGKRRSERGVALVLAIFTLMLISVIGTTLILTAGTASAIKANYKSSMQAFYDARAGLEEGRSRLWQFHTDMAGHPDTINTNPGSPEKACVFPSPTSPTMPLNQVCYIVNPDQTTSETVDPTSSTNKYADTEWALEFPSQTPNFSSLVTSDSALTNPSLGGPSYKWVRITPTTEKSSNINVDGRTTGLDSTDPLYYGVCPGCNPQSGLHQFVWNGVGQPANASQVLTVTALAKTPSGGFSGTRLLQYTVAQIPNPLGEMLANGSTPPTLNQIFPAALTLDGNGVTYAGSVPINGQDSSTSAPTGSGVQAIAYTNNSDPVPNCGTSCQSATNPAAPVVGTVTLPGQMLTPGGLDQVVTAITQNASVVLTGPTDQSSLPSGMSATNPMIVVVNGDFHLTHANGASAFTGYGVLLVTGTLYYDPDDSWNGVILVIGKGVFNGSQNGHNGQINGAVLVANTLDSSGHLLTTGVLGPASFNGTGGGNGIRYNSTLVNNIQSMMPYQVLSFREIQSQQ